MKARVKAAYYDNTGLHKPGAVVEVKAPNPYVEIIEEKAKPEPVEEAKEEKAEPKKKPKKKEE